MSQSNLSDQGVSPLADCQTRESRAEHRAWRSWYSWVLLLGVAGLGLAVDLVSKHLAFARVRQPVPLIRGFLSLERTLNFGALFGIGRGKTLVFVIASVAAVVFVGYMFATSRRRQWVVHLALALVLAGALGNLYDRLFVKVAVLMHGDERVCMGMLAEDHRPEYVKIDRVERGSSFPNTYQLLDRNGQPNGRTLLEPTAVRDFISVNVAVRGLPVWPWIFNVADAMLVVGVGLLLIVYWRHPGDRGQVTGDRG